MDSEGNSAMDFIFVDEEVSSMEFYWIYFFLLIDDWFENFRINAILY